MTRQLRQAVEEQICNPELELQDPVRGQPLPRELALARGQGWGRLEAKEKQRLR